MHYQINQFEKFVRLVEQHSLEEGINLSSSVRGFGTFKLSSVEERKPIIDATALFVVAQGKKNCYVGDRVFYYSPGTAILMFHPLAVDAEYVEASPEAPFLAAGVHLDLGQLSDVLLRIERTSGAPPPPAPADPSAVLTVPLTDHLLDPMIRLLESLDNPADAAFLGEAMVDEIYYRILTGEKGLDLRALLQQRGEIQRISKAVDYIHQNVDKPVSVEELAGMVYMGRTSFYEIFRDVMHVSPLQYAKSVKLDRAQTLIKEGKKASEAGYLVGYNSPAQFSREYKRHFGYAPSATQ